MRKSKFPNMSFFIHRGRMIPSELERLVERDSADGKTPFFVNATAGTTVTGSYDPIGAVADVAEKHGMWLHVDVSTCLVEFTFFGVFNVTSKVP